MARVMFGSPATTEMSFHSSRVSVGGRSCAYFVPSHQTVQPCLVGCATHPGARKPVLKFDSLPHDVIPGQRLAKLLPQQSEQCQCNKSSPRQRKSTVDPAIPDRCWRFRDLRTSSLRGGLPRTQSGHSALLTCFSSWSSRYDTVRFGRS